MTLEVDVQLKRVGFALDARFTSGEGLTALFGRSGSGKTTIVDIIAGLVRPGRGRVVVDGVTLLDTSDGAFTPPHRRKVGYVFQDARLFPHLSVRQNLLYGAWFAGEARKRQNFDRLVELLGLGTLLGQNPGTLSGGEKQRVAIGRALLAAPRILLMDEPLASLDEPRKQEILPLIERLRDEQRIPIVYVSHSAAEVARLATTLVVLDAGTVAACGPAAEVMERLDLSAGANLIEAGAVVAATIEAHDEAFGLTALRSRAGLWRAPRVSAPIGSRARLRVNACDVMLSREGHDEISALNVFPGVVSEIRGGGGAEVLLHIDCGGDIIVARITWFSLERLQIGRGSHVHAIVKAVALDSWPGEIP